MGANLQEPQCVPAELMESRKKNNWKEGKGENILVNILLCMCIEADFTAEGTECTGMHSVSTEECIQGRHNSLSIGSKLGTKESCACFLVGGWDC